MRKKKEINVDIKLFRKPKSNILFLLQVRNEKARRYLSTMRRKKPIPFSQKFPNADPLALCLLERMLAFEPKDRPSAEEVQLANSVASFAKNRLLSSLFFVETGILDAFFFVRVVKWIGAKFF